MGHQLTSYLYLHYVCHISQNTIVNCVVISVIKSFVQNRLTKILVRTKPIDLVTMYPV